MARPVHIAASNASATPAAPKSASATHASATLALPMDAGPTWVVVLAVVAAVATGGYLILTKWLVSRRVALRVIGLTVIVVLFASFVWVRSSPDQALFLARDVVWGESDALHYERFPARSIAAAPTPFEFPRTTMPTALETFTYVLYALQPHRLDVLRRAMRSTLGLTQSTFGDVPALPVSVPRANAR